LLGSATWARHFNVSVAPQRPSQNGKIPRNISRYLEHSEGCSSFSSPETRSTWGEAQRVAIPNLWERSLVSSFKGAWSSAARAAQDLNDRSSVNGVSPRKHDEYPATLTQLQFSDGHCISTWHRDGEPDSLIPILRCFCPGNSVRWALLVHAHDQTLDRARGK